MRTQHCKGTIAEYDMVLEVNVSALNVQFRNLYDTPVDPNDLTTTLIPNSMKLGYTVYNETTKQWEDTDEGLTADSIECPVVDINSVSYQDGKDRAVKLSVEIDTGTMTYIDDDGKDQSVTVDGWTFSWLAALGDVYIADLDTEPMKSDAQDKVQAALDQVPDQDFLPASMFCTFESTLVAKSFQLVDSDGNTVDTVATRNFLSYFTTTYSHTDHIPWILGYGISQTIPHPDTAQPKFWPVDYQYSVTPYSNNADLATVNFCMLTKTPRSSGYNWGSMDPTKLGPSFVDVTAASNMPSDGILAISSRIFRLHWLIPVILNQMKACPEDVTESDGKVTSSTINDGSTNSSLVKNEVFDIDTEGTTYVIVSDPDHGGGTTIPHKIKTHSTYTLNVTLSYASTLQNSNLQSGETLPLDTKREITVTLDGTRKVDSEIHEYADDTDTSSYETFYSSSTSKLNFSFTIDAGAEGTWALAWAGKASYADSGASGFLCDITSNSVDLPYNQATVVPTGDVFTFLGLDSDTYGHIYSHVKFKTIGASSSTHSSTRSSSPTPLAYTK